MYILYMDSGAKELEGRLCVLQKVRGRHPPPSPPTEYVTCFRKLLLISCGQVACVNTANIHGRPCHCYRLLKRWV
jgi:hypothetical protein